MRKKCLCVLLSLSLLSGLAPLVSAKTSNGFATTASFDATLDITQKYNNVALFNKAVASQNDTSDGVTIEKTTFDGQNVYRFTPVPTAQRYGNAKIGLDCWTVRSLDIRFGSLKYIGFLCYFDGVTTLKTPSLTLYGQDENANANAYKAIRPGQWQWVFFDAEDAIGETSETSTLQHYMFYPYGSIKACDLAARDVMYVSKIRFVSKDMAADSGVVIEGAPSNSTRVYFHPGRADDTVIPSYASAEAAARAGVDHTVGTVLTMPDCYYARENYTFAGWICSVDGCTYGAGAAYTVPAAEPHKPDTSTQTVTFFPDWTYSGAPKPTPEIRTYPYSSVFNKTVDTWTGSSGIANTSASYAKNVDFQGKNCVRIYDIDLASSDKLSLDFFSLDSTMDPRFDLDEYKYLSMTYYYKTDRTDDPSAKFTPQLSVQRVGGVAAGFSASTTVPIVCNRWAVLKFDVSGARKKAIDAGAPNLIVNQLHFRLTANKANAVVFGAGDNDEFYFSDITLYKTSAARDFTGSTIVPAYMDGDGSRLLRPNDTLTRAECAQILYNLMTRLLLPDAQLPQTLAAYSDVPPSAWYYRPVATLKTLGILPDASAFGPTDAVTRKEISVYVQRFLRYLENRGAVASALSFPTEGEQTVTRAEVAVLFNRLILNEMAHGVSEHVEDTRILSFDDLDRDLWYYGDLVCAVTTRLSSERSGAEYPLAFMRDSVPAEYDEAHFDTRAGDRKIAEVDALTDSRIAAIRGTPNGDFSGAAGTVYYVSTSTGSTANPGTSPSAPKKLASLSDLNLMEIYRGDVVLFKRGDTFRGQLAARSGVTYSAYGTGDKPLLTRSPAGLGNAANWQYYGASANGGVIWKFIGSQELTDVGAINLFDGDGHITVAVKETPTYDFDGDKFVTRQGQRDFIITNELDTDLEFVHLSGKRSASSASYSPGTTTGDTTTVLNGQPYGLYLRCDAGNPGSVYAQIEMNLKNNVIGVGTAIDVTVDNLCIKYFGSHGIGAGTTENLTVTNCEIGWGGGSIHSYKAETGTASRFGNGIEIYGGLTNYRIENCYVYQIYDCGITHQLSSTTIGHYVMDNVRYLDNVIEYCVYNIEYFMSHSYASSTSTENGRKERFVKNVLFEGNILRKAGYGWGYQRPDNAPSNIKGWTANNITVNYVIRGNLLDRTYNKNGNGSSDWLAQLGSTHAGSAPYLENNVFIQYPGRLFLRYGPDSFLYDANLDYTLMRMGGTGNTYYYCSEGNEERNLSRVFTTTLK